LKTVDAVWQTQPRTGIGQIEKEIE